MPKHTAIESFRARLDEIIEILTDLEKSKQEHLAAVEQIDEEIQSLVGKINPSQKLNQSKSKQNSIDVNGRPLHEVIAEFMRSQRNEPVSADEVIDWLIEQGRMTTSDNFESVVRQTLKNKIFKVSGPLRKRRYKLKGSAA